MKLMVHFISLCFIRKGEYGESATPRLQRASITTLVVFVNWPVYLSSIWLDIYSSNGASNSMSRSSCIVFDTENFIKTACVRSRTWHNRCFGWRWDHGIARSIRVLPLAWSDMRIQYCERMRQVGSLYYRHLQP